MVTEHGRAFCLLLQIIELSIAFETERWVNHLVPGVH